MATKKFIVEVEEGWTNCVKCPLVNLEGPAECWNTDLVQCNEYNLATIKIKKPLDYEELREFANQYSHNIWEQLMQRFKADDKFYIGANDVSDYVLNAILATYQKIMEESQCQEK